jgi:hypothetical protein
MQSQRSGSFGVRSSLLRFALGSKSKLYGVLRHLEMYKNVQVHVLNASLERHSSIGMLDFL